GPQGFIRPTIDVLLRRPSGAQAFVSPVLDTGSPYIVFDEETASNLELSLPFPRRVRGQGIGGAEVDLTFPADGEVLLFLSDYATEFYAWAPLVGFRSDPPAAGQPS